jgi:cofilin
MSSGVAVDDEVIETFNSLKLKHTLRWATFKLNGDSTKIVLDKTAPPNSTYDEFVKALPADDARYAIYDFEFSKEGEGTRNKILFVVWAPDKSKIKNKMLIASSKDGIRKKLVGIGTEIQATDYSEIDQKEVLEKVNSSKNQ